MAHAAAHVYDFRLGVDLARLRDYVSQLYYLELFVFLDELLRL